jgi:hypothetical protein
MNPYRIAAVVAGMIGGLLLWMFYRLEKRKK